MCYFPDAVTVTVSLPNSEATETYYRNIHFENAPVELSIKNLGTIISDEVQEKSYDPDYISPGQSETGSTSDDEQIHVREGDGIIDNTTEEQNDNETGRSKKCRERKYGNLTRNERQAKEYRYEEFINFAKKPMFVKTLHISSKIVNTALSKMKSETLLDQLGKQGGWNSIPECKIKDIKECIETIPHTTE
ncbi:hypothetical protein J6590_097957 [Homalodisca vitripennis]|nr:hypothetical protein J6590_097957 [Homalodisca vitripennis]